MPRSGPITCDRSDVIGPQTPPVIGFGVTLKIVMRERFFLTGIGRDEFKLWFKISNREWRKPRQQKPAGRSGLLGDLAPPFPPYKPITLL